MKKEKIMTAHQESLSLTECYYMWLFDMLGTQFLRCRNHSTLMIVRLMQDHIIGSFFKGLKGPRREQDGIFFARQYLNLQ
jgi:hypothetical protein